MGFRIPNPRTALAVADAEMDWTMRIAAVLAFIVMAAHCAAVMAFVAPRFGSLDFLRLHYTATRGVDWIDSWQMIFVFPVAGMLTFFANLVIAVRAARMSRQLGALVLGVTVLVEVFLAVGGILAVLLNG